MINKSFSILMLLSLAACSAGRPAAPSPLPSLVPSPTSTPDAAAAEESAVYAAALHAIYPAAMYVLMATTDLGYHRDSVMARLDCLGDCLEDGGRVCSDETVASFKDRNAAAYPMQAGINLGVPHALMTREELNALTGWKAFYERYPLAIGIYTLSRVGFDAAFDQALVFVDFESDGTVDGKFILLEKVNGVWNAVSTSTAYLS